ncbi:hypothetical protein EPD60_13210 [Flaviaesturariibacter flavus]|uniref:DUF4890 domain-containing protein n=1 Tax=Flaviaesturariibacter flavus TaxID=2502780 RepID=A0A4R1B986_9BACT|nr:hypothetical protein [Flaviaesturariibacter flavus]TCJ13343.1 hypothetical protein EPD60_13210 [Flaviaesturariibacter flavus]
MKRMITSALAILLLAGAAQAQGRGKEAKQERRNDMKELNLSNDQKTKLKDIHTREKAEMDALRNNTALTDEQRKTQRRQIHEKYVAERKSLLTPEQQKKAADFREEWKDRRGAGGPGDRDTIRRHGGPGGEYGKHGEGFGKMQQELNLTAAQQEKMKSIRQDYKGRLDALRNNTAISQEEKRKQQHELMKAQMEQMKSVLTPEQQQKMQQLRKGGRKKNANVK